MDKGYYHLIGVQSIAILELLYLNEFDLNQCGFIDAARYTLHNVAVRNGGIDIWVNIEWDNPLRIHADYLVINQ